MRRAVLVAGALFLAARPSPVIIAQSWRTVPAPKVAVLEQVDDARIDNLAEWLVALDSHRPGSLDEARSRAMGWTGAQLRALQSDATSLLSLIADPRVNSFASREPDLQLQTEIAYSHEQLARLRLMACAGRGEVRCSTKPADQPIPDDLVPLAAHVQPIPDDLVPLAAHVATARTNGDFNYLVWRAALLHTDVVTLGTVPSAGATAQPSAPATVLRLQDGRVDGMSDAYAQWRMAGAMLDFFVPAEGHKPDPRRDQLVREWYVATIVWMHAHGQYFIDHISRALELFPDSPDVLFLSGCQHEAYATPEIQEPVKGIKAPPGFKLALQAGNEELGRAAELFRRALAVRPAMKSARVRLGHVLLRLGRHRDAVEELRRALSGLDDPVLRYDAELFLGAAEENLGRFDLAQEAYGRALSLFPTAQSPYLALSELAWRRGSAVAAMEALDRMFALPPHRNDPWRTYYRSHTPDPDSLLNQVRERFAPEVSQ